MTSDKALGPYIGGTSKRGLLDAAKDLLFVATAQFAVSNYYATRGFRDRRAIYLPVDCIKIVFGSRAPVLLAPGHRALPSWISSPRSTSHRVHNTTHSFEPENIIRKLLCAIVFKFPKGFLRKC
jgi:hypothetical protein